LVYIDDLPELFTKRRNDRFADRPSSWIVQGLEALPRLDVVRTREGQLFRGFFQGQYLEFRGTDRQEYGWEWARIQWIYLERAGIFSSHDKIVVQLRSGQRVESEAVQGVVGMVSLDGQLTQHMLSNLVFLAPSPVRGVCNSMSVGAKA
jgi:dipeptidyl aminopeptidase/acylaminoacyl peptidase